MKRVRVLLLLFLQGSFLPGITQTTINDSLLRVIQEDKQDLAEANALNALVANYTRTDMGMAKIYLYKSIEIARNLNDPNFIGFAYAQMVPIQLNTGRADSAQYYLGLLKKLADASALAGVRASYNFTAGLFYKMRGNFKEALPYMMESLNLDMALVKSHASVPNRVTLAGQNLNIGNTYIQLGEARAALRYHLNALQLFEELNNKKGMSFCYQGIGNDFLALNQYKQALSYTARAISIKNELADKRGIATALEQMGSVCLGLKQYDSAIDYYRQALKIVQEMKLTPEEANIYANLGKTYSQKKDIANARLCFQNSKLLAAQIGDSSQSAAVDAALAALQTTINKQHAVEEKLINTLHTSIESGDKSSELLNYQYLADHYSSIRQFDKALEYTNKYHQVNDSLQNADVQLQMKRMEEQYNLEKKEKEIALLRKDQQLSHLSLQKQKTFQFGSLLLLLLLFLIGLLIMNRNRIVHNARRSIEMEKMRNRIARDLHDDIGSTLTSINILSNVSLQPQEREEGALMRTNLQKIKERSSAIMESMDDIVWAINPQNDTMEQLLFRMKEFATEILEPLNINYSFEEKGEFSSIKLDIKKRKDFYLIFKEAINNAAKYSQCSNLYIRLQQSLQMLHMEIADNGKGFVVGSGRNGNGLNNMQERAASMGARILIDSTVARGTRIALDMAIT